MTLVVPVSHSALKCNDFHVIRTFFSRRKQFLNIPVLAIISYCIVVDSVIADTTNALHRTKRWVPSLYPYDSMSSSR